MKFIKQNILFIILICLTSVIFLTNLNGQYFSLDEPETVFVAKSITQSGFPSAWYKNNLISVNNGADSTIILGKYVWTWHPWLQHYLALASIKLFGDTPGGARFLFALLGVLTVLMTYKVSLELFEKKSIAFLVGMQLVLLLPFFLYVRQVRYYSPSAFFSTVGLWLLIKYLKNTWKKNYNYLFALNGILLFFSNYLIWASYVAIFILTLIKKRNKKIFLILGCQIFFAIVWILIFRPYGGGNIQQLNYIHGTILNNLYMYLSYISGYIFPPLIILIAFFLTRKNTYFLVVLCLWCLIKIITYTIFLNPHGRYLVDLFPVFTIIFGYIYLYLWNRRWFIIMFFIFALFSTTNFLHTNNLKQLLISHRITYTFWIPDYIIELKNSYSNSLVQIGDYLKTKSKPGDLFWSNSYNISIFLSSDVPSISPVCDKLTNKFGGPPFVANPDKIRWFIFFQNDPRYPQSLKSQYCFGSAWQQKMQNDYVRKIVYFSPGTVAINDPDIVNRRFPPEQISSNDIYIYEKK